MGTAWPKEVLIRMPLCVGDTVTWDPCGGSTPCPDLMVRSIDEESQQVSVAGMFIVNGKQKPGVRTVPTVHCIFDRKNSPDQKAYL